MLSKIKSKLKKNTELIALGFLIFITIISTTYYNYNKKKVYNNYKNILNNIYLKKTVNHFFNSLEPKFKKIEHKISKGETFQSILERYSVNSAEIEEIKKKLKKKTNLNKLNTDQKISFTIDQTNNQIKEFIFQISTTKKIFLTKNLEATEFNQKIIATKLDKDIIYKENIIQQSLYRSAVNRKIPINIIIEFARIYGFQIDLYKLC